MENYKEERRMRVFGGPNGSGKSTVFDLIDRKFDTGVYLNADEIEKEFKSKHAIDLSDYGLNSFDNNHFSIFLKSHTLL